MSLVGILTVLHKNSHAAVVRHRYVTLLSQTRQAARTARRTIAQATAAIRVRVILFMLLVDCDHQQFQDVVSTSVARWPSSRTLDLSFQGGRFKSCHRLSGSDLRQVVHTHVHSGCSGLVVLRARNRKAAGSQLSRAGLGGLLYSLPRGREPDLHWPTASNLEQVANPHCAQANSAFHPSRVGK